MHEIFYDALEYQTLSKATQTNIRKMSMLTLETIDGAEFSVPVDVIGRSGLAKAFLADKKNAGKPLRVPHVTPDTLARVLGFCYDHASLAAYDEDEFAPTEKDLADFAELPPEDVLQVAMAADIMQIPELLHIAGEVIAKAIDGKDPEQVRAFFALDSLKEIDDDGDVEINADDDTEPAPEN